ncbi:hypothetical protein AVEN_30707-1 [Araneus ventricosus]|uniref:Uncharacterized protein n=1 Tax=Araneus ventricosus TaxID=182803 RepID=A0A4Y2IYJ9_ARAVE|nr:hypothetical protein AVEN_30707-1 [Araneus ventricosus]
MMMIGSIVDYVRSGRMRNVPVTKAVEHLYATTAKFSGCVLLASCPAYSYPTWRLYRTFKYNITSLKSRLSHVTSFSCVFVGGLVCSRISTLYGEAVAVFFVQDACCIAFRLFLYFRMSWREEGGRRCLSTTARAMVTNVPLSADSRLQPFGPFLAISSGFKALSQSRQLVDH